MTRTTAAVTEALQLTHTDPRAGNYLAASGANSWPPTGRTKWPLTPWRARDADGRQTTESRKGGAVYRPPSLSALGETSRFAGLA